MIKKISRKGRNHRIGSCRKLGIYIPTLCHHESLLPYGGCRLCVVEIFRDGGSELTASCTHRVEEGLTVKTATGGCRRCAGWCWNSCWQRLPRP